MPDDWNPAPPPFAGRLIVVAGQCSKVGKTALVADLITALPEFEWTAVKITPHAELNPALKDRDTLQQRKDPSATLFEERDPSGHTDTARFLAAGAKRAIWIKTNGADLEKALPLLVPELGSSRQIIIESNAIVRFWRPGLLLLVLDPLISDFKQSAASLLPRVDAFVFRSPVPQSDTHNLLPHLRRRPSFLQPLGQRLPKRLPQFVRQCLLPAG
jgi:hypothetical protein